jgi:uncharacterized repeat protein (TIGR01451 family)
MVTFWRGGLLVRNSRRARSTRTSVALVAGLIATLFAPFSGPGVTAAATASASAGTPRPAPSVPSPTVPGLSITVSDGQTAAKAGDRLTYVVNVRDAGPAAAPHLKITQSLSAGLEFLSASPHGVATAGQVAWPASIPAGRSETFNVVARVTRTPAQLLRLAAVACAAPEGSQRPIVCAAHLDRLSAAVTAATPRPGGPASGSLLRYIAAGLAALAVLVAGVIAGRRVRLRRQPG